MQRTDSVQTKIRCLVTGGAGFIGSHVTDQLISIGTDASVLDDLSPGGFEDNLLFHLAAYAAEGVESFHPPLQPVAGESCCHGRLKTRQCTRGHRNPGNVG
jgi:hypothetical protein